MITKITDNIVVVNDELIIREDINLYDLFTKLRNNGLDIIIAHTPNIYALREDIVITGVNHIINHGLMPKRSVFNHKLKDVENWFALIDYVSIHRMATTVTNKIFYRSFDGDTFNAAVNSYDEYVDDTNYISDPMLMLGKHAAFVCLNNSGTHEVLSSPFIVHDIRKGVTILPF